MLTEQEPPKVNCLQLYKSTSVQKEKEKKHVLDLDNISSRNKWKNVYMI